jgi:predicted DNA-binding protein
MVKKTSVNIHEENRKKLDEYCKLTGAIPTNVVNLALEEFLDKMLKKVKKE